MLGDDCQCIMTVMLASWAHGPAGSAPGVATAAVQLLSAGCSSGASLWRTVMRITASRRHCLQRLPVRPVVQQCCVKRQLMCGCGRS
jgi:hypothetical protein